MSTLDGSDGSVSERPSGLPSATETGTPNVAVGATLSIDTVAPYSVTPPSLSRILAPTARVPLSFVEQVAVLVALNPPKPPPSPQSNVYSKPASVSTLDGSVGLLNDSPMSEPSLTGEFAVNVAEGATLSIVTVAPYSVTPPSLSRILAPTARVPLSFVEQVAVLVAPNPPKPPPSPQSNAYSKPASVSTLDGSVGLLNDEADVGALVDRRIRR